MTSFLIWWHRVVLRHEQQTVMNGETEPGVRCYCYYPPVMRHFYLAMAQIAPDSMINQYRWFPSDGGNGR